MSMFIWAIYCHICLNIGVIINGKTCQFEKLTVSVRSDYIVLR